MSLRRNEFLFFLLLTKKENSLPVSIWYVWHSSTISFIFIQNSSTKIVQNIQNKYRRRLRYVNNSSQRRNQCGCQAWSWKQRYIIKAVYRIFENIHLSHTCSIPYKCKGGTRRIVFSRLWDSEESQVSFKKLVNLALNHSTLLCPNLKTVFFSAIATFIEV